MFIDKLDAAIRAVCPIEGVLIGDEGNKATWSIQFRPEATAPQKTAAQAALNAFDPVAAELPDPRIVADDAELNAGKLDGTILLLINQTRAEWLAWAGTSFPSLTNPERNRMGVICWILSLAVRNLIRK
jgi:hypothetical protein